MNRPVLVLVQKPAAAPAFVDTVESNCVGVTAAGRAIRVIDRGKLFPRENHRVLHAFGVDIIAGNHPRIVDAESIRLRRGFICVNVRERKG